jgi:thioredoxin-related protein
MKRIILLLLATVAIIPAGIAGEKKKKAEDTKNAAAKEAAVENDKEIHWLTLDEVQVKMKEAPKKVYMDIYTDWCGWCKVMERKTFTNDGVIKYMNEKYYAVRFNAEQQEQIRFMGKMYDFKPQYKANELAVELMHGQMSYPTSMLFEENFLNAQPVPGYQDVPTMEMILKFFGEGLYKTTKWEEYTKNFKPTWKVDESVQNEPNVIKH